MCYLYYFIPKRQWQWECSNVLLYDMTIRYIYYIIIYYLYYPICGLHSYLFRKQKHGILL